jgi:endonuclease/exonuclease/phosphatase family metal-dependent hydrolase
MIRLVTYNVHKCRGLDGRLRPDRILRVLRELEADVCAVQEIFLGQAVQLAGELGYHVAFGESRRLAEQEYGNAILSRWPLSQESLCDITISRYEPRSCHSALIKSPDGDLRLLNVHMGTGFFERKQQVQRLLDGALGPSEQPRILTGDFNEWVPGLTSRLLSAHLESVDVRLHLRFPRTYPGILPVLHLDHIYHDAAFQLRRLHLHRSRNSLIASDHLPLLAEFDLNLY